MTLKEIEVLAATIRTKPGSVEDRILSALLELIAELRRQLED